MSPDLEPIGRCDGILAWKLAGHPPGENDQGEADGEAAAAADSDTLVTTRYYSWDGNGVS